MTEKCFKCGLEKPLDEFYRHPQMGNGYLGKCKKCTKIDVAENYRKRFAKYREYERMRFKDPARKRKVLEYAKKRQERNPDKVAASRKTSNAIKTGRLIRPEKCSLCGAPEKIQAHHNDYSKPLEVEWLCFKCHRAFRHGQKMALVD